jgi:uncharacterized protein YndB with AHSA1/START domain
MPSTAPAATRELNVTRRFAAPPKLVFAAWLDRKHLAAWWGPRHFTNPVCEADPRPGGAILIHMRAPDGTVYPMTGKFIEIVSPKRLVFTTAAIDGEGKPLLETKITVTFTEVEEGTEISMHVTVTSSTPVGDQHLKGMSEGWSQSLDRLKELVLQLNASQLKA